MATLKDFSEKKLSRFFQLEFEFPSSLPEKGQKGSFFVVPSKAIFYLGPGDAELDELDVCLR